MRRPRLSIRGRTFVALLGPAIEEGLLASAIASGPPYAPSTRNTCDLSHRLLTGIKIS